MPVKDINPSQLSAEKQTLFDLRAQHSNSRLQSLMSSISRSKEISNFEGICIFTAGSYARLEASEHSDIDLFFISKNNRTHYADKYNLPTIRMFSEVVRIGDDLGFLRFSNDGQYLKILHLDEILDNLCGSQDDYTNNFTARLLMILESRPVHSEETYKLIVEKIVES